MEGRLIPTYYALWACSILWIIIVIRKRAESFSLVYARWTTLSFLLLLQLVLLTIFMLSVVTLWNECPKTLILLVLLWVLTIGVVIGEYFFAFSKNVDNVDSLTGYIIILVLLVVQFFAIAYIDDHVDEIK